MRLCVCLCDRQGDAKIQASVASANYNVYEGFSKLRWNPKLGSTSEIKSKRQLDIESCNEQEPQQDWDSTRQNTTQQNMKYTVATVI